MGDEGSIDPTPLKKAKTGDLKRVAEIVMVLSAMGEMRAGKDPTAVEKALVAEARGKLAGICEAELKPKDLISREAVRAVVEDLGLNRSRDPMMGFRPTKMSIAEKLQLTKKKMEESKGFASHSSAYSSQHPSGEFHGTLMHGTPKFLADRQAFSAGGFHNVSPGVHVSTVNSGSSSLKQQHVGETQLASTPVKLSASPLEKDSPFSAQPHAGTPHLRFDGRFNGSPYLTQVQATSAEKTPAASSVQSISAVSVKPSQPINMPNNSQGKPEGSHVTNTVQTYDQVARNQEEKVLEVHGTVANLPVAHQPAQGVMFVPGTSFFTNHEDISKSVQKILQPKVFDHPNWNPPSAEYTNKPINCQICKVTITDIESLLVCDACEKGTHLKCLQSYGNKEGAPKAEWHCPRCLITNNGKPFPPKYGRVTRTITPQKAPLNTVATSASSEKKPENSASKVNEQKPVANGNSSLPHLVHANSSATNSSLLTRDSKTDHPTDCQYGMNKEDETPLFASTNNSTKQSGVACATLSVEAENSDKDVKCSKLLTCTERSTFESILDQKVQPVQSCPGNLQDTAIVDVDQFQAPSESKEVEVPINMEVYANQQQNSIGFSTDESKEPSEPQRESQHKTGSDVRLDGQDSGQDAPEERPSSNELDQVELKETSGCEVNNDKLPDSQGRCKVTPNRAIYKDGSRDCGNPSVPDSDAVHWFGDILQVIDDKTYYQSCQINGVTHKLQNHVLVSSSSQSFLPSKIQSLWEDNTTRSKWAVVSRYYLPSDLPEVASRPSTPENNEVYASNKENTITASSICGPCEVLSMQKFKEADRRTHLRDENNGLHQVFMCRWLYDESKGIFQSITD